LCVRAAISGSICVCFYCFYEESRRDEERKRNERSNFECFLRVSSMCFVLVQFGGVLVGFFERIIERFGFCDEHLMVARFKFDIKFFLKILSG
jgi:hypothetical protein